MISNVAIENAKNEPILKVIKDLLEFYYMYENPKNVEDCSLTKAISFANRKNLDEFKILNDVNIVEKDRYCLLQAKNDSNLLNNSDGMLIDLFRYEIVNMKSKRIDLDKMDNDFFNILNDNILYKLSYTDKSINKIDTILARWYYGKIMISTSKDFEPSNKNVRLGYAKLTKEIKKLLRDYPTTTFEFDLIKTNGKYKLVLVGGIDITCHLVLTKKMIVNNGLVYNIDTETYTTNTDTDNTTMCFVYGGKTYETSNKKYKKNLIEKPNILL